jgi:DNA processing protein
VETIEDIEQEISPAQALNFKEEPEPLPGEIESSCLDSARSLIKENLSYVPISVDELIRECQLSATDMWVVLLEMEIAGRLERLPGGRVALKEEWKS